MRFRVTQITKDVLNAQQRNLLDCKIPQKSFKKLTNKLYFQASLGLSTLIMELEDRQAYKVFETGVAICSKLNAELICLAAALNLNAK